MSNLSTVLSKWIKDDLAIIPPKQDQAFNQGGSFVFRPGGSLELAHCDRGTGDHADLLDIVKAVEALVSGGGAYDEEMSAS